MWFTTTQMRDQMLIIRGTGEKWKFSCDNKLVAIILLEESIFIKYAGNNVARYEHWMHDQGKEVKVTKRYEYDRNNILQTIRTTWGDITGDGDLLKVQNYRNGLTKIDAAGNSFIYSYKKR